MFQGSLESTHLSTGNVVQPLALENKTFRISTVAEEPGHRSHERVMLPDVSSNWLTTWSGSLRLAQPVPEPGCPHIPEVLFARYARLSHMH